MKKLRILYLVLIAIFITTGDLFAKGMPAFDKDAFIESAKNDKIIELSLKECIAFSLSNNSELKIKRIEPIIAKKNLRKAESAFEPLFTAYYEYDETNEPAAAPTLTGKTEDKSRRNDYNIGVEGKLFTNTEYDIYWDNGRYSSNSALQRFFPNYESSLGGSITQPVLKNFFGMGEDQANIVIAKNNMKISDYGMIEEAINVVTRVKSAYYDYAYCIDQYRIGELSLESAKDLQEIVKKRYEKGLSSSVELLEGEAGVTAREEELLSYERELKKSEDELKLVTNLVDEPALWNATIQLKDKPVFEGREIDLVESIKDAFENRADYKSARVILKNKDVDIKVAKNNLLPTVDVIATCAANGLGDKYKSAVDQVKDGTYGSWSIGFDVKVPFGFLEEISNYKISKLEKEKAIIAFCRLEQNIILGVRDAVRNVDISYRNIKATEKRLDAEKKTYEATKARFSAGLISTHDMLEYQKDFDSANLRYQRAIIDYNKALINLAKTKGTTLEENSIIAE